MARSIEAYAVMALWRSIELIKSCLESLNLREILAPAILSRSLLELASVVIINSNTIYETVKKACAIQRENSVITSTELEGLIVRAIHGTRIGEPPEHLKQTNVLTFIQRVSRNPEASGLLGVYEYLCDLAHPNVLGNARFWASVESKNKDGSDTPRLERNAESEMTREIREKILWALSWSAVTLRSGFEMGQDAVRMILQRWP